METHKSYYIITNEEYSDNTHYESLKDAKNGLNFEFTNEELSKRFGENHVSMIERNGWNKEKQEYEVQSYTPFIYTDSGLRFFATTQDWHLANRYIQDYKLGIY